MVSITAQSQYQSIQEAFQDVYLFTESDNTSLTKDSLATAEADPEAMSKLDEARAAIRSWADSDDARQFFDSIKNDNAFVQQLISWFDRLKSLFNRGGPEISDAPMTAESFEPLLSEAAPIERRFLAGLIRLGARIGYWYVFIAAVEFAAIKAGFIGAAGLEPFSFAYSVLNVLPLAVFDGGFTALIAVMAGIIVFLLFVAVTANNWLDQHGQEAEHQRQQRDDNPFAGE